MSKNLISKYGLELLNTTKMLATETRKIASKRALQETAEATRNKNKIGNEIAYKMTSAAS